MLLFKIANWVENVTLFTIKRCVFTESPAARNWITSAHYIKTETRCNIILDLSAHWSTAIWLSLLLLSIWSRLSGFLIDISCAPVAHRAGKKVRNEEKGNKTMSTSSRLRGHLQTLFYFLLCSSLWLQHTVCYWISRENVWFNIHCTGY